jgi:hypothetical protein
MRFAAPLAGVLVWLQGCTVSPFACVSDAQCVEGSRTGMCQSTGFCSFPDASCSSGQRYGANAGDGLGGRCAPEEPTAAQTTDLDTTDAGLSSDSMEPSSSTSSMSSTSSTSSMSSTSTTSEDTGADEETTGIPIDPDLVAWYRFEDPLDGVAEDSTSSRLHGTCVACPTQTLGVEGSAAQFDGSTQFITLPNSPLLELTEALTVSAWARVDAEAPGYRSIAGHPFGTGTANSWELAVNVSDQGLLQLFVYFVVSPGVSAGGWVPLQHETGTWFHVAVSWDGSDGRLYLDGDLEAQHEVPSVSYEGHPARIGADFDHGMDAGFFAGAIDEVRIYRRALSPLEIAELATL